MGVFDNFKGFSYDNPYLQGNDSKLTKQLTSTQKVDSTEKAFSDVTGSQVELANYLRLQIIGQSKKSIAELRQEFSPSVIRTDYAEKVEENNVKQVLLNIFKSYDKERISVKDIRTLQSMIGAKQDGDFGPNTFSKMMNKLPEKFKSVFLQVIKSKDLSKLPSLKQLIDGFKNPGKVGESSKIIVGENKKVDKKEEEKLSFFSKVAKKVDSLLDSFDIKTFNTKDILAIIQFESFFNPNAKSKKKVEDSSVGLMAITIHPIKELKEFGKKVMIEGESLYEKVTEKVGKLEGKIKDIKESLFDADTNLTVGTSYLKILEVMWGGKKYPDKQYKEIANKSDKMKPRIKILLKKKNMDMDDDIFSKVIDKLTSDKKTQEKYYLLSERYNTASKPLKGEIMAHKFYYALLITYLSEYLEKNGNFDMIKNIA